MLWSKYKGYGNTIREWANINASIVSRIEEKYSENPFNVSVKLDEKSRTGILTIVNRTSKQQKNVSIKTDLSQALSAIALDYDTINIEARETAEINFKYAYGGSRYSSLMSFRVISDSGEENVAVAYTLLHTLIPKPEPVKDESAIIAKGEESKSNSEKNTKDN